MKFIFFIFILHSSTVLAEGLIAVVDMDAAILATSDGKALKTNLEKEFKLSDTQFKERAYSLRDRMKAFDKKVAILSEQKREEQRAELQEMAINFQKDMQKFQVYFQKKQMTVSKPIADKLQKCITQIAEEKNFDIVINRSQGQVLWAKPTIDITETVVKMYEGTYPNRRI